MPSRADIRRAEAHDSRYVMSVDEARTWARIGVLAAFALVLSYIETFIPFNFGVPGIKLGLANLVVLLGLTFLLRRLAQPAHAEQRDAVPPHGLHLEQVITDLKGLANLRHEIDGVKQPAGDGRVFVGLLDRPPFVDCVVDGEPAVYEPLIFRKPGEELVVGVELISNLVDDFLDYVLDGN